MNIKLSWSSKQDLLILKKILKNNQIAITDTDTIPGFLGNVMKQDFDKIRELKGERDDKPFLVLVKDMSAFSHFVDMQSLPLRIVTFLKRCWPGPLTVIAKAKLEVPEFLTSENHTIAIRCPQHDGLQNILEHFQGLLSTSANRVGERESCVFDDVDKSLLHLVDCTVRDKEQSKDCHASTIIDITSEPFTIVRQGAMSEEKLKELYESI